MNPAASPNFILTLKISDADHVALTGLRREYFPPERNFLEAHVTLFHKLPGDLRERWFADLETVGRLASAFRVHFGEPYTLGRGFALRVESPPLAALRGQLVKSWFDFLSPQDRQKFNPHCTIQNKVEPAQAKADLESFRAGWRPLESRALGFQLWEYLNGPWRLEKEWLFKP